MTDRCWPSSQRPPRFGLGRDPAGPDQGSFGVRIGVHTGEVILTADDLLGLTVDKAARVAAAADSGSIMISSTTRDLVGPLDGIRIGEPIIVALKGLSDTRQIVPIEWE